MGDLLSSPDRTVMLGDVRSFTPIPVVGKEISSMPELRSIAECFPLSYAEERHAAGIARVLHDGAAYSYRNMKVERGTPGLGGFLPRFLAVKKDQYRDLVHDRDYRIFLYELPGGEVGGAGSIKFEPGDIAYWDMWHTRSDYAGRGTGLGTMLLYRTLLEVSEVKMMWGITSINASTFPKMLALGWEAVGPVLDTPAPMKAWGIDNPQQRIEIQRPVLLHRLAELRERVSRPARG